MRHDFAETEELSSAFRIFPQRESGTVTVCNAGTSLMPAWSAGRIVACLHRTPEKKTDLFSVLPAVDEEDPWGILAAPLAPGESGEMWMTGILPARIVGNNAGTRVRATPEGLQLSSQGRGELLAQPGGENVPAAILLGPLSGSLYNGCFKLVPTGGGVKIINGADPENPVCGYTDLPGCPTVPATEFANFSGPLYFYATCENGGYHTHFGAYDASLPMRIAIGYVRHYSVEQYMLENTARFGRDFFL